jgi:hypothetical protein
MAKIWMSKGLVSSGNSKEESVPHLFQLLEADYIPYLVIEQLNLLVPSYEIRGSLMKRIMSACLISAA